MITSKVYSDYVVFVQSKSLRGRSKAEYLRQVRKLAERHPERSLKQLTERMVFDHLIHLRDEQELRPSTLNRAVVALRLFYRDYLRRDWQLWDQEGFQQEETEENGGVSSCFVVSVICCKNPDAPQGKKQFTLRTATRRLKAPGCSTTSGVELGEPPPEWDAKAASSKLFGGDIAHRERSIPAQRYCNGDYFGRMYVPQVDPT